MNDPADGSSRSAGAYTVRSEAERLLRRLGVPTPVDTAVEAAHEHDWASSGVQSIALDATSAPRGDPALLADAAALAFETMTGVRVDGPALLGERAALMNLRAGRARSAGGGTRLLPAADGWWALNLARDADLVPALVGSEVRPVSSDMWAQIERWARERSVASILERTSVLGLAAGGLGETRLPDPPTGPWRIREKQAREPGRRNRPLVLSLGALWAAPLAAHLLGLAGCRVIHVESHVRPDPTRSTAPAFFSLLHAGHEHLTRDFGDPGSLAGLVSSADIVIEASRPRALSALGVDAETTSADGRARTWLRITGHSDPRRVAFGDDAAVAGGLVSTWRGEPAFAGDAIADPLTGLLGALAVMATVPIRSISVIDLSLADVAAHAAALPQPRERYRRPALPHLAPRRPNDVFARNRLRRPDSGQS